MTKHLENGTFDRPEELVALLQRIAVSRVLDMNRKHHRTRRNDHEGRVSLDERAAQGEHGLVSRQPSASELLEGEEALDELLQRLPKPYRVVVLLKSRGHKPSDIAAMLKVDERYIQRVLKQLRDHYAA